ncbi:hypothetical protein ACJIZ3_019912 [Penstemon smallii]|uniref:Uncharacterized protein n=1 Tax=Penstemon smallii TaxID=265156 RepID=A0ABD3T2L6_9LAMI
MPVLSEAFYEQIDKIVDDCLISQKSTEQQQQQQQEQQVLENVEEHHQQQQENLPEHVDEVGVQVRGEGDVLASQTSCAPTSSKSNSNVKGKEKVVQPTDKGRQRLDLNHHDLCNLMLLLDLHKDPHQAFRLHQICCNLEQI